MGGTNSFVDGAGGMRYDAAGIETDATQGAPAIRETSAALPTTSPLERRHFADPDWFAWEGQHLFTREWLLVGHTFQWPQQGCGVACDIAGQPLLFLAQADGSILGFHNVCRHRGALLINQPYPSCTQGVITCPYHGWSYNLDGTLRGVPHGEASTWRGTCGLTPVATRSWSGLVFTQVNGDPRPLHDSWHELGALAARWNIPALAVTRELTYDVRANWKVIFQNYSECYHCPLVHPALNRLTPYQGTSNQFTSGPILGGPMQLADGAESMTTTGKRVAPPLPSLTEQDRRSVYYFTIFPSCFLSLHPDYVMIHALQPLSQDRTRVRCQFLFQAEAADESSFDPAAAVDFWDLTNRQDWEVCERVQQGTRSSAFCAGVYTTRESMVAAFDRHYHDTIRQAAELTGDA